MKKIIVLAIALFTFIGAYCQKYANIYCSKIGLSFLDGAKIKINTNGKLILYNGHNQIQLYIEKWAPTENCFVYDGDKVVDFKRLKLKSTDYCILNKDGEKYTLCIRGEKIRNFEVYLSPQAKQYFDKYASPSHAAHWSGVY